MEFSMATRSTEQQFIELLVCLSSLMQPANNFSSN